MISNFKNAVKIVVTKTSHTAGKNTFKIEVVDGESVVYTDSATDIRVCDSKVWSLSELYNIVDIEIYTKKAKKGIGFKLSEIPSIPVLDEQEAEDFFDDNKDFVFNRVIQAIGEGIQTKRDQIRLFELGGMGSYMTTDRVYWVNGLVDAIKYFESQEDYEQCHKAKLLQEILQNSKSKPNKKGKKKHEK